MSAHWRRGPTPGRTRSTYRRLLAWASSRWFPERRRLAALARAVIGWGRRARQRTEQRRILRGLAVAVQPFILARLQALLDSMLHEAPERVQLAYAGHLPGWRWS